MGFFRQEYWSELPCPPPGDLPNPGIEHEYLMSLTLAGKFFTTSATWESHSIGSSPQFLWWPKLERNPNKRGYVCVYIYYSLCYTLESQHYKCSKFFLKGIYNIKQKHFCTTRTFHFNVWQNSLQIKKKKKSLVLDAQSCPTFWPHGLWLARLLCSGGFPGENVGVGWHFFLQGIFLTQESNPALLHCRWDFFIMWATRGTF